MLSQPNRLLVLIASYVLLGWFVSLSSFPLQLITVVQANSTNNSTGTNTTNTTTTHTTITNATTFIHESNGTFSLIDSNTSRNLGILNATLSYFSIRSSTHLFNIRFNVPNITKIITTNVTTITTSTNRTTNNGNNNGTGNRTVVVTFNVTNTTQTQRYLSTMFTFDNNPAPRRVYCDSGSPYQLYENPNNGTAYGNIIQIGRGTITATPYEGTNCTGVAGPTTIKVFNISGCRYDLTTTKISTGRRYFFITQNAVLPSHTCNISTIETFHTTIRARHIHCGFPQRKLQLTLFNRTIPGVNEMVRNLTVPALPLFLFGFPSSQGAPLPSGNIRPGLYSSSLIINDIPSPLINFTITDQCFVDFNAGD